MTSSGIEGRGEGHEEASSAALSMVILYLFGENRQTNKK